ncbi:MAG: 16S rRNA (adenine(1518)-N(6)/adenine(1519)-N(6))-dimethyltransferase RsmA [Candidatus Caenarcaniphilales bacterium]|nr:16S rRNA (adenine(1518)-N(6)/adenine(1519)-N(6))-dimethyltransferase RsmA [Candidatus Caenarcaniphilales bacterium]
MNLLQRAKTVKAKKSLGQNFLVSEGFISQIVDSFNSKTKHIVEIGPGLGFLTEQLLDRDYLVTAIDLDPIAKKLILPHDNLNIQILDALHFDFNSMKKPFSVAGNLPFNVGTKILMNIVGELNELSWRVSEIDEMVLMFQLEVAKRIAAKPNSKDYGPLSITVQAKSEVEFLFDVPANCFYPKPKVNAGVIRIKPQINGSLNKLNQSELNQLKRIVKQSFMTRRKKLSNCLSGVLKRSDFEALSISPDLRPENLSLTQFIQLAKYTIADLEPQ